MLYLPNVVDILFVLTTEEKKLNESNRISNSSRKVVSLTVCACALFEFCSSHSIFFSSGTFAIVRLYRIPNSQSDSHKESSHRKSLFNIMTAYERQNTFVWMWISLCFWETSYVRIGSLKFKQQQNEKKKCRRFV